MIVRLQAARDKWPEQTTRGVPRRRYDRSHLRAVPSIDHAFGRRSVVARFSRSGYLEVPESAAEAAPRAAAFAPAEEKREHVTPIRSGAMAEVALVHDKDLKRDVAMKPLRGNFSGDAEMRSGFVAEAPATSQLSSRAVLHFHTRCGVRRC